MTQEQFDEIIETLEAELEDARDLLRQALEDEHNHLIIKTRREIREIVRKIENVKYDFTNQSYE